MTLEFPNLDPSPEKQVILPRTCQMSLPSFDEIAAALGPHRLADCFSVAFDDRYGYDILSQHEEIPREFRLAHNVCTTLGFLGGEGIHGLLGLEGRESFPHQLAELGFPGLAKDIQQYLYNYESIPHEEVNELERRLFRLNDDIFITVGTYIHDHAFSFSQMLPYVRRTLGYLEVFDPDGYDKRVNEILADQAETLAFIEQLRAARAERQRAKGSSGGRLTRLLEIVKSIFRP